MSFDRIAPHYHRIERFFAGQALQRCRTALLDRIPPPSRVLILGEGDGRFLEAFLHRHPQAAVTCIDASATMLDLARARTAPAARVAFVHADILTWKAPTAAFDLIVTHFVLDCFRPADLASVVARLAAAATPDACWLLADFRVPAAGPRRWLARGLLRFLYAFFRRAAAVPADRLTPPDPFLESAGFVLREQKPQRFGLLHSDLWLRRRTRNL